MGDRRGDEYSPDPDADWSFDGGETVHKGSSSILITRDPNQEGGPDDSPLRPGQTRVIASFIYGDWRAIWKGTPSVGSGLGLEPESMNESMRESIHEDCSLRLYSIDDNGYACHRGDSDTGYSGCSSTYMEILAKKQGHHSLHFTRTERDRCRGLVGSSDEEEEEEEEGEGGGGDTEEEDECKDNDRDKEVKDKANDKDDQNSGQADTEARTDITDTLGRYNVVRKYETLGGSEEMSWPDHTVTISRAPIQKPRPQDPPLGPGEISVVAELVYGSWR